LNSVDRDSRDENAPAEETPEQLMEPFIAAACTTLSEMASAEIVARGVTCKPLDQTMNGISAVVRMVSPHERYLIVTFPEPTAAALAKRMLADVAGAMDDTLVRDCVGEISNVIAGQAEALLAETRYRFSMSLPQIVLDRNHELLAKPGVKCLAVPFACELGEFTVQLVPKA
jgi:chemotaxis protein CheX